MLFIGAGLAGGLAFLAVVTRWRRRVAAAADDAERVRRRLRELGVTT